MEMTQEWIDNFNRKCVKFLEWEKTQSLSMHTIRKMHFHEDWNWILEVVEKIESTHDDFHGYFAVYVGGNSCTIQGTNLRTTKKNFHPAYFDNVVAETKKQAAVVAIDRFLDWHNKKP